MGELNLGALLELVGKFFLEAEKKRAEVKGIIDLLHGQEYSSLQDTHSCQWHFLHTVCGIDGGDEKYLLHKLMEVYKDPGNRNHRCADGEKWKPCAGQVYGNLNASESRRLLPNHVFSIKMKDPLPTKETLMSRVIFRVFPADAIHGSYPGYLMFFFECVGDSLLLPSAW